MDFVVLDTFNEFQYRVFLHTLAETPCIEQFTDVAPAKNNAFAFSNLSCYFFLAKSITIKFPKKNRTIEFEELFQSYLRNVCENIYSLWVNEIHIDRLSRFLKSYPAALYILIEGMKLVDKEYKIKSYFEIVKQFHINEEQFTKAEDNLNHFMNVKKNKNIQFINKHYYL